MKSLLVVAMLMVPIAANASTGPEIPSLSTQLRCTWITLQQAARGDFSQWVLPDFLPGPHLHAGEYPDGPSVCDRHRPSQSSPEERAILDPTTPGLLGDIEKDGCEPG